jgi:hypothetical protein
MNNVGTENMVDTWYVQWKLEGRKNGAVINNQKILVATSNVSLRNLRIPTHISRYLTKNRATRMKKKENS